MEIVPMIVGSARMEIVEKSWASMRLCCMTGGELRRGRE